MNNLKPIITQLNKELNLQQPAKVRFILEITLDMQDYLSFCQDRGMSEKEALAATKERFLPNKQTLDQTTDIHLNLYKRWFGRLSQQVQKRWEKIMRQFFSEGGPYMWVLLLFALTIIGLSIKKAIELFGTHSYDKIQLESGINAILF